MKIFGVSIFISVFFGLGVMTMANRTPQSEPQQVVSSPLTTIKLSSKTIKVAVIDTGFDFKSNWSKADFTLPKICNEGHQDFSSYGLQDVHGHGTHIAGLVGEEISDIDYCIIALKFYHDHNTLYSEMNSRHAFLKAVELKVDVINYSGGGNDYDASECQIVKYALDQGIHIVAAAGNEKSDINKQPYYPAMCDERVVVVQNVDMKGKRVPSSNYSLNRRGERHLYSENGLKRISLSLNNTLTRMTGSSQSTAIMTGKVVRKLSNLKNWKHHYFQAIRKNSLDS